MGLEEHLGTILKLIAAIFCAAAVGINTTDDWKGLVTSNAFMYAAGGFIILIIIFIGWTIMKEEVDKTFAGWMMVCGFIWNLGGGLGVVAYYAQHSNSAAMPIASGCLEIVAGIVMLLDALHCLDVF